MPTIIPESQFLGPNELNNLQCVSSSRFLNTSPESVTVIRCCQDEQNPSLVEIDYQLAGVYEFTPVVDIVSVDGVINSQFPRAPLAVGNIKNLPLPPISTNCQTIDGTLVFDFSEVIPNFLAAQTIVFDLVMAGSLNTSALQLSFPPSLIFSRYLWTKGQLPRPINMHYVNGQLTVVFEYGANIDCSCNIQCIVPSGIQQNVNFCAGQQQTVSITTGPLTGQPTSFSLSFATAIGNTTSLTIQSLVNVIPSSPTVVHLDKPRRVEIGIDRRASNGTELNNVEYQIWKYEGAIANLKILHDWNHRSWQYFIDKDVIPDRTYGYAVRYKGQYQDMSRISIFTEVTIPPDAEVEPAPAGEGEGGG